MISHDRLAQYWEEMGHISYYQRVDIDALIDFSAPVQPNGGPLAGTSGNSAPWNPGHWESDDEEDDDE